MMNTTHPDTAVCSRRHMLSRTARTAAAFALFSSFSPLLAAPEKRGFKIGACEWSLRDNTPATFDIAKEIGLDGVEVNMGKVANNMWLRQPAQRKAYLDASRRTGVEISSLATAEMNNVPLKSDPRAAVWLVDAIDIAPALGVKVILVAQFSKGNLLGDPEGVDRTVDILREIAPRAEKADVILGLENYLSAKENLDILRRVGSPAIRVYYDVGNSTDKGYDILQEIRELKDRMCMIHFKDAKFMLGQGRIDFAKVREALDDIGYRGWVQIEAAAPNGVVEDYKAHLAYLRPLFPKTL